jgi:hypothetical protein
MTLINLICTPHLFPFIAQSVHAIYFDWFIKIHFVLLTTFTLFLLAFHSFYFLSTFALLIG